MLILTRTLRESDVIILCPDGTQIEITLVHIGKTAVGLGFSAPGNYEIYRRELLDRIDGTRRPEPRPTRKAPHQLPERRYGR